MRSLESLRGAADIADYGLRVSGLKVISGRIVCAEACYHSPSAKAMAAAWVSC